VLVVFSVALALTMGVWGCQRPDEGKQATDKGKVVELGIEKLTMTDMEGKNQHDHKVNSDVVITCEGKPCGLSDVKAGDMVTVTTEDTDGKSLATKIEAKKAAS
jgi:hypothetical protein